MKKLDIGQTTALLANIGVILSLVFVGFQIHQSAKATRAQTVLQLKSGWVELNLSSATSVDLANALDDVWKHGWNDAESASKLMVAGFYRTLFHNWSDAYYQYRQGTLDEEQWTPYEREMEKYADDRTIVRIWSNWNFIYDDSFRALMNGYIAKAASKPRPESSGGSRAGGTTGSATP